MGRWRDWNEERMTITMATNSDNSETEICDGDE